MLPSVTKEYEYLRTVYDDIVRGYSYFDKEKLYVRHLAESDIAQIYRYKADILLNSDASELPTYSERETKLIADGEWSKEQEERITELKIQIKDNLEFLAKIPVQEQKDALKAQIDKLQEQLDEKEVEKRELFGNTREEWADKEANNYILLISLYTDADLKKPLLSKEDYETLYDEDFYRYLSIYQKVTESISSKNINKIACMGFFSNSFSYCKDRPEAFFGKPLAFLTLPQFQLLSSGVRILAALNEAKGEPPSIDTVDSLDKIVKWFDLQYSIMIGKREGVEANTVKTSKRTVVNNQK